MTLSSTDRVTEKVDHTTYSPGTSFVGGFQDVTEDNRKTSVASTDSSGTGSLNTAGTRPPRTRSDDDVVGSLSTVQEREELRP